MQFLTFLNGHFLILSNYGWIVLSLWSRIQIIVLDWLLIWFVDIFLLFFLLGYWHIHSQCLCSLNTNFTQTLLYCNHIVGCNNLFCGNKTQFTWIHWSIIHSRSLISRFSLPQTHTHTKFKLFWWWVLRFFINLLLFLLLGVIVLITDVLIRRMRKNLNWNW